MFFLTTTTAIMYFTFYISRCRHGEGWAANKIFNFKFFLYPGFYASNRGILYGAEITESLGLRTEKGMTLSWSCLVLNIMLPVAPPK